MSEILADQFRISKANIKKNVHLNAIVQDLSEQPVCLENTDGILTGKSIAIKENIHIKGVRVSCASKILHKYKSIFDATVIERIKQAGGSILATTNMDEFAMGSSSEHSIHSRSSGTKIKAKTIAIKNERKIEKEKYLSIFITNYF